MDFKLWDSLYLLREGKDEFISPDSSMLFTVEKPIAYPSISYNLTAVNEERNEQAKNSSDPTHSNFSKVDPPYLCMYKNQTTGKYSDHPENVTLLRDGNQNFRC